MTQNEQLLSLAHEVVKLISGTDNLGGAGISAVNLRISRDGSVMATASLKLGRYFSAKYQDELANSVSVAQAEKMWDR